MPYDVCPIPGERSREWLQRTREDFTVARNPMPDAQLIPGKSERARELAKSLGMERTLAKKWED
jgi:hypothetical protein